MGSSSRVRQQLGRLVRLLLALRTEAAPNADELAHACGVSRRTIYRDLDTLAQAGVPVQYEAERRGYELAPGFRFEVPRLEETELAALVLLVASCDDIEALGRREEARRALGKLMLGWPGESLRDLHALVERVGPGPGGGSAIAPERKAVFETILAALVGRKQVRVEVLASGRGTPDQSTRLSPYRLLRHGSRWLIVGRSSAHRAVRTFDLAQLRRACLTEDAYTIPPRFRYERHPESGPLPDGGPVRLRFRGRAAALASEQLRGPRVRQTWDPDGRLEVEAEVDDLDTTLDWLLGFGDEIEVLDPPELRERFIAIARRVILNHLPVGLAPHQQASRA